MGSGGRRGNEQNEISVVSFLAVFIGHRNVAAS